MNILMVIGTLSSQYGGPVTACISLAQALHRSGHSVTVLAPDGPDDHEDVSLASGEVAFVRTGKAFGRYRLSVGTWRWLSKHIEEYSAVFVHGVWQFHSQAVGRLARRRSIQWAVFAHGALDPWFRSAYPMKHLKKALYWRLLELPLLRRANGLIFTSEDERRLAESEFPMHAVGKHTINYGILDPYRARPFSGTGLLDSFPELRGKRIFLFMSRIHKKKGLDLLICGFASILRDHPESRLVIAGPDEEGIQHELVHLSVSLGCEHAVVWTGMLTGELKWSAYSCADLFCLISHSENFGIVVAEALSAGLPVAISDKVNIYRIVQKREAGLVCEDTEDGAKKILSKWLSMSTAQQKKMKVAARDCFESEFDISKHAPEMLAVVMRMPPS